VNVLAPSIRRAQRPAKASAAGAVTSDKSVQKATGYTWEEWFGILDTKSAARLPHKEIAAFLGQEHELDGWWAQMITVSYERARGLRVKNQKCDGSFSANVSRTVAAPLDRLYEFWTDPKLRAKWLPDAPLLVRKATRNKSLRLAWNCGTSRVSVDFLAKGRGKSQVALGHEKLSDLASVREMKRYWGEALERMKVVLA
jgi:hypothetical protein